MNILDALAHKMTTLPSSQLNDYELSNKKTVLVGIAFDTATKNVSSVEYEQL